MPLHEACTTLAAEATGESVILILDASESASSCQRQIDALARELIEKTRVDRIYFLGNPVAYPANEFARQSSRWFQENRLRASLLIPLLKEIRREQLARQVVIGSGAIYDLDEVNEQLPNLLLVSVGEALTPYPGLATELASPNTESLLASLRDPIVRVQIAGPGFLPVFWHPSDASSYRLDYQDGSFMLIGENLSHYTVRLRYLCEAGQDLQAKITHRSGVENIFPMEQEPAWTAEESPQGWLTPDESALFDLAAAKQPFTCPCCLQTKLQDHLRCHRPGEGILPKSIYNTLRDTKGLVLLQREESRVRYRTFPNSVLQVSADKVAMMSRGARVASLFRFDRETGRWQTDREMEPYYKVGEAGYVITV